jgi:hypothetical protein
MYHFPDKAAASPAFAGVLVEMIAQGDAIMPE